MKKIALLSLFILIIITSKSYSQPCDGGTPTFAMNLTGNPDSVWISPNIVRAQTCCGLTANCIEFNVTLDINSIGIILNFASGAVPPGLLEYNDNCGAPVVLGSPMYLSGVGPHRIVFCKPGNNTNEYSITAIPRNINIPDVNFKAALLANNLINTNLDGEIQVTEAATYTGNIDVSLAGISDLTGIEEFTAITYLDCSENQLTSLSITNNTALNTLLCNDNLLSNLDVSANTLLDKIVCTNNQLTNLDISANTALTILWCGVNQITSLDVSANTALTVLFCNDNLLTSLNVSNNTALTSLACNMNQLTSLNLTANTALTYLNSSNNVLTLNLSTNTALTELHCRNNQLTNLDISANTALNILSCGVNQLTSLNVSANTALTELTCRVNQLTSLSITSNTALTYLDCDFNQLSILDVSANTSLTYLSCKYNTLSNLNISLNTLITELISDNNQLTNLNMQNGNNINLTGFNGLNNPLLRCVQVDDVTFMNTNWPSVIDPTANYNTTCAACNIVLSTSSTAATCNNANSATAMVTPSGGTIPYTYLWTPSNKTNSTATSLSVGNYSVLVEDANLCAQITTLTLTQTPSATVVVTITVNSLAVSDGKLYLFKQNVISSRMDTISTATITTNIHTFTNVDAGNYLVYYKPNSVSYPNTPGTYNGNFTQWDLASFISRACNENTSLNINATTLSTYSGPGSISGRINEGGQFGKINVVGDPIPGVDITLEQNPGGIMLDQTTTNTNGEYLFTNLPISNYRVLVNIPGTNQIAYQDVTITATFTSIVDVNYIVDSTEIYILSNEENLFHNSTESKFKVIPNPFDNKAQLVLANEWKNNNQELLITITDISGKLVYSKNYNSNSEVIINRENLENGMYFITIKNEIKSVTEKIILTN